MIQIHFVGDGPRDAATLPALVSSILGVEVDGPFFAWNSPPEQGGRKLRLNRRGGYARKLIYAVDRAIRDRVAAVVAVVDQDKEPSGDRMRRLREGRLEHRGKHPEFPTAVGEAVPHGEVWLLDDPAAVRKALGLGVEVAIVTTRKTGDPKGILNDLIRLSDRRGDPMMDVLADIARAVQPGRCNHAKDTGFHDLAGEVRRELGSLVPKPSA